MIPQVVSHTIIKENWLTRAPRDSAYISTLLFGVLLGLVGYWYLGDSWGITPWMAASGQSVLVKHEYWRLWTALFAHADIAHLLGNMSLLLPLAFMLTGHFGVVTFPVFGILLGGLINFIVIHTMPPEVSLVGISGVVYWMGSTWLTLFLFIDRRKSIRRRIALSLFLTVVLFIPETYKPEVSYMSHFVGYLLGVVSGVAIYYLRRSQIDGAEVKEIIYDPPEDEVNPEFMDADWRPVIDSLPDDVQPPKSVI
jgi:rhomboid protease GluP